MKPRTTPASSPPPDAGFPIDFQDLCSRAMDQALGIEKVSLSTVVSLNSCVLDIYQEALRLTPVFGNLFNLAAQAVACSIELQMKGFTLMTGQHVATPGSAFVSPSGTKAQPTAEELAQSMDVAIGEKLIAPGSTVTSISRGQVKHKAKANVLERSMDIAIRARAA